MRRFACNGDSATSKPPTATLPEVGGMKPVIMRMVVDLPAPFGPRKPSTSPRSTVNEMPSTARFGPNVFTRLSILIMRGCLQCGARFSHKPKEQNHAVVRKINRRCAIRSRCGRCVRAEVADEARAHHRALRARRRLGLHRALYRAAPDRRARRAGDRGEA